MINDEERTADVIAIEICQVYRLNKKTFMSCIASQPEVYKEVEQLAENRKEQTKLIDAIHKKFILQNMLAQRSRRHLSY